MWEGYAMDYCNFYTQNSISTEHLCGAYRKFEAWMAISFCLNFLNFNSLLILVMQCCSSRFEPLQVIAVSSKMIGRKESSTGSSW